MGIDPLVWATFGTAAVGLVASAVALAWVDLKGSGRRRWGTWAVAGDDPRGERVRAYVWADDPDGACREAREEWNIVRVASCRRISRNPIRLVR